MEIIMPAAGLSTRFPNMRPKYTLTDYSGLMMFERALQPYIGKYPITIGLLKEHNDQYQTAKYIEQTYGNNINVVILPHTTTGPADTIYQILKNSHINDEILIKDCDSFFDGTYQEGNCVYVSNIHHHPALTNVSAKSFVISNSQGIITGIIEKQVVSDKFCAGGYKFESSQLFVETFDKIANFHLTEIFVSHIIDYCLANNHIFKESMVTNFIDVGTAKDWYVFNDKSVVFCDIDGTIIKAQMRHEYNIAPTPLYENIKRVNELAANGGKLIFTTARPSSMRAQLEDMLLKLGFTDFQIIDGLPNTKRILINDYNDANPYPRAVAVNIKRDDDSLPTFI